MGKYEVKDKKIKVFGLKTRVVEEYEQVVKTYIHNEESGGIWAFVRELSETERFAAKSVQTEETTIFKVVYNPKIVSGLYIEFAGKTYEIVSTDKFEFNKTDIVIRGNETRAPVYDEVEYENY